MKVAVFSNARCTVGATKPGARGWMDAFNTAFRAGGVMGFSLCGIARRLADQRSARSPSLGEAWLASGWPRDARAPPPFPTPAPGQRPGPSPPSQALLCMYLMLTVYARFFDYTKPEGAARLMDAVAGAAAARRAPPGLCCYSAPATPASSSAPLLPCTPARRLRTSGSSSRPLEPASGRRQRCRPSFPPLGTARLRPRRLGHRDVRPRRRRHLHQGGGRRCRPRRQGGRGPARGRPAQPRHHRRQRRRQRWRRSRARTL